MAERWTRERRLEHTRNVLLDAAAEVVTKRGFGGASLEDIAEAAGFTRGAIYSRFANKEELFFAVIERHQQRLLDGFSDLMASFTELGDLDAGELVDRWRELAVADADSAALAYEFALFLLRNPEARTRLSAQREQAVHALADYITAHTERLGATTQLPAQTLARVLLASNEAIAISGHIDGVDLYGPFLQLVLATVSPTPAAAAGQPGVTSPDS